MWLIEQLDCNRIENWGLISKVISLSELTLVFFDLLVLMFHNDFRLDMEQDIIVIY